MDATKLTVLYDERCAFCIRCRDWLADQPVLVAVELVGAGTDEAKRPFPDVEVGGSELVVVDDRGQMWAGPDAFIICLWATAKYRSLAMRLSRPAWKPLAATFFHQLSMRRDSLSAWVGQVPDCEACDDLAWDRA
jgi:predicted DCC family thiol-disulfide oxidoreductase YuxK